MEALQRSAVSFRRQGSSGFVWDDKLLAAEISNQQKTDEQKDETAPANIKKSSPPAPLKIERSRSNGCRGFRAGKVSPAFEPPSPRVSACGCFGKNKNTRRPPKRVM